MAVAANTVRAEIDTQVNNSEELKAMLHALEEQYDSRVAQRELGTTQVAVPDAEDIGAEVEDFLPALDEDERPRPACRGTQGSGPRRSSDDTSHDDKPDYHPRRGGDLDN